MLTFITAGLVPRQLGPRAYGDFSFLSDFFGQVSGAVFFATDRTRLYRNIGMFSFLLGLPISAVLILGAGRLGLPSVSVGLAIKTVAMQIVVTNLQLYSNGKLLGFALWRYVLHQVGCIAMFLAIAAGSRWLVDGFVVPAAAPWWSGFLVSGAFYSGLCALTIGTIPRLAGLEQDDLRRVWQSIRSRLVG